MPRRLLIFAVIVLILLIGWVLIQPSRAILGTLAGEAFHAGRPTSFYTGELSADPARKDAALKMLKAKEAIPVLREILKSTDASLRLTALEILAELGPDAHVAGKEILQLLDDSDPLIPPVAAASIPKVGISATEAIPALLDHLEGPAGVPAIRAISTYKAAAKETVPQMEKILLDNSLGVELRWNAARTIGKIGPDAVSAVPALISLFTDPEVSIREHAAEAIGDIGPSAASAIPELVKLLGDENDKVRRDTVRSLGYLGAAAREIGPQLVPMLEDKAEIVRAAARTALEAVSPELLPQPKSPEPKNPEPTSPPEVSAPPKDESKPD